MRSDVGINHLLQDGDEIVGDGGSHVGGEAVPDGVGSNGHSASQCCVRVSNSVTLARVSLLDGVAWGGPRFVALRGIRRRMGSRYTTTAKPRLRAERPRAKMGKRRPWSG